MLRHTGVIVVRQAGSASAIVPAAEELLDIDPRWSMVIIAFPQAVATCKEVAKNLSRFMMHAVMSEEDARNCFERYCSDAAFVLTGTSEESLADAYYWRRARLDNIESIAFLDQWSNIDKRFPGSTQNDWPDNLAVIDTYDKELAQVIAPKSVQIHVTGSPALDRIKREVDLLRLSGIKADPHRIVFATEPVANVHAYRGEHGFCDEDSFALAVKLIRTRYPGTTLVIRLHPRDTSERWLSKLPCDIPIEWDSDTRSASLARAGRIFGMRSFFLVEAFVAGVPVVSLQPGRRTSCPLTDARMPVIVNDEGCDA